MKRITAATAIAALAVALWPADTLAGPTVDAIKKRGKVICGVNGNRAGFSALDSKGQWQGMDVDTCKAVAAAILGDKNKVQFVKTTTQTRFTALQTGEVDVLTRNVPWTLSRDSKLGIDFVAPTFYDGQGFMVNKNLGVKSVKDLGGATVCVLPGTSSEKVAEDVFKENGLKYTAVVIESKKELNTAFFGGRCLAMWKNWKAPNTFDRMLDRAISEQAHPYLAFAIRSCIGIDRSFDSVDDSLRALLRHPERKRFIFSTPAETLAIRTDQNLGFLHPQGRFFRDCLDPDRSGALN